MEELEKIIVGTAITALGKVVVLEFTEMINQYPPEIRPMVIGQIEALVAGVRTTFSENENKLADMTRDNSQIVTIVRENQTESE